MNEQGKKEKKKRKEETTKTITQEFTDPRFSKN